MVRMIASCQFPYGRRRLQVGEQFDARRAEARVLAAMGKATYVSRDMVAGERAVMPHPGALAQAQLPPIAELRQQYQANFGKRAFHGWDAAELQRRLNEAAGS